jgi:hypothetical protein
MLPGAARVAEDEPDHPVRLDHDKPVAMVEGEPGAHYGPILDKRDDADRPLRYKKKSWQLWKHQS